MMANPNPPIGKPPAQRLMLLKGLSVSCRPQAVINVKDPFTHQCGDRYGKAHDEPNRDLEVIIRMRQFLVSSW
jgi:hypothetical protein